MDTSPTDEKDISRKAGDDYVHVNARELCVASSSHEVTSSACFILHETSQVMRYSRLFYLPAFLVNLMLIFSSNWMVNFVSQNVGEDTSFRLPGWILYATIAVFAPPCLVLSRLLPDPSLALVVGGTLTCAGLCWTWLEQGPFQMVTFGVITGAGLSLTQQATGIVLSSYFIKKNTTLPLWILLASGLVMLIEHPLMTYVVVDLQYMFLCMAPLVVLSSLLPLICYLYTLRQPFQLLTESSYNGEKCADEKIELSNFTEIQSNTSCSAIAEQEVRKVFSGEGWTASILSFLVWLTWGAGVDTTWLSLGWRFQYFSTPAALPTLQLLFSFVLAAVKMRAVSSCPCNSSCQVHLASNYMQLGILGTAGLILSFFPEFSSGLHSQLLFTVGLTLQYDDSLQDHSLIRKCDNPCSLTKYQVMVHQLGEQMEPENPELGYLLTAFCRLCHLITLLLISALSMVLGVQIANILGYVCTLPPVSFICSGSGLVVISVVAVTTSLLKPSWTRKEARCRMLQM